MSFVLSIIEIIKRYKTIIICGTILTIIISAFLYIKYLNYRIDKLKTENTNLHIAYEIQKNNVEKLQKDIIEIQSIKDDYINKIDQLKDRDKKLREQLFREQKGKKSLEDLILMDKKNRIEKSINKASNKVLRCLEIVSGDVIKENENVECK